MSRLVLLTGAGGYVGSRLLPLLAARSYRVRCLASWSERLEDRVPDGVEVVHTDAHDAAALTAALADVECAFDLAATPGGDGSADRQRARTFDTAARAAGVRRIVRFAAFGSPSPTDTPRGRDGASRAPRSPGVPTIELRASIIIGPGSLAYETIRALAERLPVLPAPRWMRMPVRPIFIGDVLAYLLAAADLATDISRTFTIGGPDTLSYSDMVREYARLRGLRRWLLPIPGDAPRLSSLWLSAVTPLRARLGRTVIDRIRSATTDDVTVGPDEFPVLPIGVHDALAQAMRSEDAGLARTRWSVEVSSEDIVRRWGGRRFGNRLVDSRVVMVEAPAAAAFAVVEGIGGRNGWYSTPLLWWLRGWMDVALGGVGMRRGRRDPDHLVVGDAVDCWRVAAVEPDRQVLLAAEMKVPGRGWLVFEVHPAADSRHALLRQTALFDPLGLTGLLYWYALWPFHQLVFAQMVRGLARRAEGLQHTTALAGPSGVSDEEPASRVAWAKAPRHR